MNRAYSIDGLRPEDLHPDMPHKFRNFRREQIEAVDLINFSDKAYVGESIPPGGGKSLIGIAAALASGSRACILTATRGLQDQYLHDFEDIGLKDIRGKSNYTCADCPNVSCRFGPIEGCRYTNHNGCVYETERDYARQSQLVITNYAYWLKINERQRGLEVIDDGSGQLEPNKFDMLILDEGHLAHNELSRGIQVVIKERWLLNTLIPYEKNSDDILYWRKWAYENAPRIDAEIKQAKEDYRKTRNTMYRSRVYELEELLETLAVVKTMNSNDWVCEQHLGTSVGRVWVFDVVHPGRYAKSRLFFDIPKVVIMSGTLRPTALTLLGLRKHEFEFREWDRIFPARLTPVYHLKTARITHYSSDEELDTWVDTIDEIIESRKEWKGIIHTVSYSRQKYLLSKSRFSRDMVANTNDPESLLAFEAVERFKSSDAPCILVSPSFSTGWDFPGDTCRWQIISKVPFPDPRSKVMQARVEHSPRYPMHLAMQDLVQASARGSRYETDWCEVFIVDDCISGFMYRNKNLAPSWFKVTYIEKLPKPMGLAMGVIDSNVAIG